MMLLNGGVLGLVRHELPASLKAGTDNWRIATLLVACAMILFIVQTVTQGWLLRPAANTLLTFGVTLYGRGLRHFFALPDRYWMLLPTALTALGVFWFDAVVPSQSGRVFVSSLCWLFVMGDSLRTLLRHWRGQAVSHRVMVGIYVLMTGFAAFRLGWLMWWPGAGGSPLDSSQLVNALTPLVLGVLPVIGTTVFLLMCSDRIRRDWERAASTDYLTGLPNRRVLAAEGERLLRRARRSGQPMALAVVDIDHFKNINDCFGHEVGDEALCHVARLLKEARCGDDLIVRLGGEEFVLVLADTAADDARRRMEQLRDAFVRVPFSSDASEVPLTVSIGLTCLHAQDDRIHQLLHRADAALYQAKESGRNRLQTAAPASPRALGGLPPTGRAPA